MFIGSAVVFAALTSTFILFNRRLSQSANWRAMVTPLASIIGSGFLVLGPILAFYYGEWAPLVMIGLCGAAYLFGWSVRYNIQAIGDAGDRSPHRGLLAERMEDFSSWALALAYIVSVTYYLNLFGAFSVNLTSFDSGFAARCVTTAIFTLILMVGWFRGFQALERLEYITVVIKLAIIAGVIVGLAFFFFEKLDTAQLTLSAPHISGWSALTLAFGLIITVQGFETSRYLGETYSADTRVQSMRMAQWLSSALYLTYAALLCYSFAPETLELSETAIISMMRIVSPVLPFMLVAAALAAQFSAAVADTSGSGGLFVELTRGKISSRQAYALLALLGIGLTWSSDVFDIIAYASRAFALYYALQAMIAAITAARDDNQRFPAVVFACLAIFALLIFAFGQAIEG